MFEGGAKGRFFVNSFATGIDRLVADASIFGPAGNQAPAQPGNFVVIDNPTHGQDELRGREVVIGTVDIVFVEPQLMEPGQKTSMVVLGKSSAHLAIVSSDAGSIKGMENMSAEIHTVPIKIASFRSPS